jgi:hypothetical protein
MSISCKSATSASLSHVRILNWEGRSAKYFARCSEADFFSVLLDLLFDPYIRGMSDWEERKRAVLQMYQYIVRQTIDDSTLATFANASALHLICAIHDVSCEIPHPAYYKIAYDSVEAGGKREGEGFRASYLEQAESIEGIDLESIVQCVDFLSKHRFAQDLQESNPIPLFLQIWEMSLSARLPEHRPILRDVLLKGVLIALFPQRGEVYQLHLQLFPIVANLFDEVSNSRRFGHSLA